MKRVFSWILVVVLCLGMLAGCKKNETASGVNVDDLNQALAYVKTVYKNVTEKTPKDFQRIGNVPVNGVDYEIVWSANVGEEFIKVVKGTDGMVTIDVNEEATEDVKYELTATVAKGGVSVSHTWKHLLPAGGGSMLSILEDAYALANGESLSYEATLKGKITAINTPWSDQYGNITVTIVVEGAEDKPVQCYRLTGEGAKDLSIGDVITVTGTLKNYNGTIEFDAGCTLDAVVKAEKVEAPEDPKKIVEEAYALPENGALPYEATLTGKITKIDTSYNDVYGNVTVTMVVEGLTDKPIQCYRLAGKGADKIGVDDTITVTGWIVNYKGKVQFGAGCKLVEWKDTGDKDPESANKDNFVNTMVTTMVTEPKEGVAYKFYMNQAARNEILYLTGEMDGYYMATTKDPSKAVDVYYEEVSGGCRLYFMKGGIKTYLAMEKSGTHNNAVFSTSPYTLKWNSSINGPTGKLDEDLFFGTYSKYYTFGASPVSYVTGSNAGDLDTKNFVGHLGIVEEKAVEKESAAEQAFAQLKADYFTDAEVTETPQNYERKNVYEIEDEKVKVTWTVTGSVATVVDNGNGTATVKVTRGTEDVPYVLTATIENGDEKLTQSWNCSVPALPPQSPRDIVEAAYALEPGESMADKVTLSGIIAEINTEYNAQYDNITVTIVVEDMLDMPIMCYRMKGEGIADLVGLENITVTGTIKNYNGTIEFDAGCTMDTCMTQAEIVDAAYALEAGAALEGKYSLLGVVTSVDTPYSEQYGNITVTIEVPGCEDKPVQCYRLAGSGVELLDVGYMVVVYGTLKNYNGTIEFDKGCALVAYGEAEEEEPEPEAPATTTATVSIADYAAANNWANGTKYTTIAVDENITVTATGRDNTGKYYTSGNNWRIYQTETPSVKVEAAEGNIVSVKISYAVEKGGVLTLNGEAVASGTVVEVNAPSVTFSVGNSGTATNGQARITVIEVVYAAAPAPAPVPTTATVSIADYAAANNWANGTKYTTIAVDENITVTATGRDNTGKYYTSGNNWRIYQTETPSVKVEAAEGNIVSVKISYAVEKGGVLTLNGEAVASGTVVEVNAPSVTFSVGNSGTATNGQARITAIEVIYTTAATGGSGEGGSETPAPVPTLPDVDGAEVSIADAIAYAGTLEHNAYTSKKYNVTGEIVEVYNTQHGNMRIKDAAGNILTIYGSYSADGSTRYDALTVKPVVGDTVTIYGKIGQFSGTPQIKNGWIVDHQIAAPVYPGAEAITNVVYVYGSTSAYTNVIKNWGRRDFDATFMSPNAIAFYADNDVTYEELAALTGSSNVTNVPSSALYAALNELMESNHTKQTTYGDTRDLFRYTDCQDQIDTAGISCFYSANILGPAWDSGDTWNREHCWPKSKSNATWNSNNSNGNTGELGDLMTLRPVKSNINSSRSNKAYGISTGYYDPNTSTSLYNVRGDVARIVLYTYVRWEDSQHMWGTDGVIENVDVLLDWMAEDPVDTWEMGRNDSVESVTGTRNVFVDYPELAFILFGEEVPNMTTPSGKAAA